MENTAHKTYRCTDHGSDATAHEDGIYFIVHAGSRFGPSENPNDRVALLSSAIRRPRQPPRPCLQAAKNAPVRPPPSAPVPVVPQD